MSSRGLMCSICLDVFNDPVSTPCGHNFCKICLSSYWNNSQDYRCPNCNETFNQRPDLKINTTLRDLVDEHKKKSPEEQPEAEVVCDICTDGKLKAVKSCLVCQSSYCETHLESHLRVSGLQKHKLIDPVKNLQDYICQKHDRPLELFCRDDHTCVCLFCTEGDHKNHNTVPIRESELHKIMKERQRGAETQDEYVIKYLEQEIIEMKKKDAELLMVKQKQITAENVVKVRDQEITELKKRNAELLMAKQKQKTAERQYENTIRDQDQEITDLKKRNTELEMRNDELKMVKQKQITAENVIKVRDQEITDLKKRNIEMKKRDAELKMVKQKQITAENVIKVRDQEITHQQLQINIIDLNLAILIVKDQENLSRLQKSSSENLFLRIGGVVLLVLFFIASVRLEMLQKEFTELQKRNGDLERDNAGLKLKWMQQYAVDVTLDPDTADPDLILSDDEKQVRTGDIRHKLPDNPKRFDRYVSVLGKEGFSSGRFYYEVQVKRKSEWTLGVVRESVNRKGFIPLTPLNGFWSMSRENLNAYLAFAGFPVSLSLSVKPQKVGVFVDYEEGLVSFYDVESKSHIYTYTGQSFTEKLYPYFGSYLYDEGKNLLIITPVIQ